MEVSNRVYQKDEDVFYAVSDDEDDKSLNEIKSMSGIISKNHTESKKRVSKNIMRNNEEAIQFGLIQEITPVHIENKFYDPIYSQIRKSLPQKKKDLNINVWSILKDAVGKDLSKFCVPGNKITLTNNF